MGTLVSFITLAMMHYGGVDYQPVKYYVTNSIFCIGKFNRLIVWFYLRGFWVAIW